MSCAQLVCLQTRRHKSWAVHEAILQVIPKLEDHTLMCIVDDLRRFSLDPDVKLAASCGSLSEYALQDAGFRLQYTKLEDYISASPFPACLLDMNARITSYNSPLVQASSLTREALDNDQADLAQMIDVLDESMVASVNQFIANEHNPNVDKFVVPLAFRSKNGQNTTVLAAVSCLRTSLTRFAVGVSVEFIPMPAGFSMVPAPSSSNISVTV